MTEPVGEHVAERQGTEVTASGYAALVPPQSPNGDEPRGFDSRHALWAKVIE